MATVIDAFVTTLGLDGTLFRRGMQDAEKSRKRFDDASRTGDTEREKRERAAAAAAKKRQAEQDARVKTTVAGYAAIRNQLLGLAAIFTAGVGIKDFVTNTINGAAGLGYLSANLKLSTQELTSWQRASERAGGSGSGIIAQLKESQETLAQLKSGMGPNEGLQSFFRWGGNSDDLKDGNTYLLARSRIISEMFKADPAKAALVSKSMGIGEDQFNFLKQGPAAVIALVDAQEKNAVITMRDAEAALELKNKMLDLRDSLQATGIKVLTALLPSLIKLSDWLISMADFVAAHRDDIAAFFERVVNADWSKAVTQAKEFGDNIATIVKNIREMSDRWDEWTGNPKKKTAGVEYFPGNIKFGHEEDLNADQKLRGKPAVTPPTRPKNQTLAKISDGIEEFVARTMASLGNQRAREFIRDTTGKDDYLAGPRKSADAKTTQTVMQKLKDMGWTNEQAAGITGSFTQESGLDPKAVNPRSGAYGIGQWLGPRVTDFKQVMGRDLVGSSLEQQLAFFDYEVTEGKEQAAGKRLAATRTAEDAARVHSEAYERPGTAEANVLRRQQLAAALAAQGRVSNATRAAAIPSGATAAVAAGAGSISGGTSTTTVTVEKIEVNTAATDAAGIAQAMRPAVQKYTFANQANSGIR